MIQNSIKTVPLIDGESSSITSFSQLVKDRDTARHNNTKSPATRGVSLMWQGRKDVAVPFALREVFLVKLHEIGGGKIALFLSE